MRYTPYYVLAFLFFGLALFFATRLLFKPGSEPGRDQIAETWNSIQLGATDEEILKIMGPPAFSTRDIQRYDGEWEELSGTRLMERRWTNKKVLYTAGFDERNVLVMKRSKDYGETGRGLIEEPSWLERLFAR